MTKQFNSLTDLADACDTSTLWCHTHGALLEGRWSRAITLLDKLGARSDVTDQLSDLSVYQSAAKAAGGTDLGDYRAAGVRIQLADRIDQINWRIEHRAEGY